jgi:hypothetical protein
VIGLKVESSLPEFASARGAAIRRGAMRGAVRFQTRAKLAFRADVRQGGLGQKLANTWQDKIYPSGKVQSWHPAVLLYSKAPEIVRAHTQGATIRGKSGNWLAIPTENTPRRGRRYATPLEVEGIFNQDLITYKGRGQQVLAFVQAIRSKGGRGFRRATKRRTKDGRENELVLMFVMVRQVTLQRRLNWPVLADQLAPVFRQYLAEEIAIEMAR